MRPSYDRVRAFTHNTVDGHNLTEDDTTRNELRLTGEQATYLMRFLVLMRGALTPPPNIDAPVMKIPLQEELVHGYDWHNGHTYHPAPSTLSPRQRPIPVDAHAYGLVSSRNWPTLKASPEPAA